MNQTPCNPSIYICITLSLPTYFLLSCYKLLKEVERHLRFIEFANPNLAKLKNLNGRNVNVSLACVFFFFFYCISNLFVA